MKFKNLKLKIGAVVVLVLLLVTGVSNIPANTVVITDESISDDSGNLLNFTNDWLNFINATFRDNVSVVNITSTTNISMVPGDGEVNVTGDIWVSENVTADYFVGDGSLLTGISAGGGGDYDPTKIWTSKGDNYTATTANIQVAIDSFGSTFNGGMPGGGTWGRGTVWLPGNTTFTFNNGDYINMTRGIILDMQGATLRTSAGMTTGEYIIKANRSCVIRDGTIDVNPCNSGNGITDLACILVDGDTQITGEQTLLVENIHCVSWNWKETAFYLRADTNNEFCNGATFRDCRANGMKYGVRIDTQGDGVNVGDSGDWSYQNDNLFDRFHDEGSSYPVWLDRNTSESNKNAVSCDGNIFLNLFIQHSLSADASKEAIHIVGRGNRFVNAHVWDWSGGYVWNITSDAEDTYISCRGGTTGVMWENNGATTMLIDYGQNNIYLDETFADGYGSIRAYSSYWTDCDTSRINNDADRSVYFFMGAGTDEREKVYVVGNVGGTKYDGSFWILADKNFNIGADVNISIDPDGNVVYIKDVLNLPPIAEPSWLSDGSLFHNATSSKLNFHDGINLYEVNMTLLH